MSTDVLELRYDPKEIDQSKFIFLQLKIMEQMGFGKKRSELEWSDQGYSARFEELFLKENLDPNFARIIPSTLNDEKWGSDQVQAIIAKFIAKLEKPVLH